MTNNRKISTLYQPHYKQPAELKNFLPMKLIKQVLAINGISTNFLPVSINEAIPKLKNAIANNNSKDAKEILDEFPAIVNRSLNSRGETPLIFSIKNYTRDITYLILQKPLDISQTDFKGLTAIDHANAQNIDPKILAALQARKKLVDFLQEGFKNLAQSIALELDRHRNRKLPKNILKEQVLLLALEHISQIASELAYYPNRVLDLYLLLKSVFQISCQSDIKKNLLELINVREKILKGDASDYCYALTLANHFSCQLVELICPGIDNPANQLLQGAMNLNRSQPWENLAAAETSLPDSPGEFYRTAADHIHLYEEIVTRAIANLKRKYSHKNEIWFGSDPENCKDPLPAADLEVIKQRTPTLKKLVEYTESLERSANKNFEENLFERLSRLRRGLIKGDKYHKGTETQAAKCATLAVAEFADWWHGLGETDEGKEIQKELRKVPGLSAALDNILRSGYYCTNLAGTALEAVLIRPENQEMINKLSKQVHFVQASDRMLDKWQKNIVKELKSVRPKIVLDKDLFLKLSQDNEFVNSLKDLLNYNYLLKFIEELDNQSRKLLRLELLHAVRNHQPDAVNYLLKTKCDMLNNTREIKHILYFLQHNPNLNQSQDKSVIKELKKHKHFFDRRKQSTFKLIGITCNSQNDLNFFQQRKLNKASKKFKEHYALDAGQFEFWSKLSDQDRLLYYVWFSQGKQLIANGFCNLELFVKFTSYLLNLDEPRTNELVEKINFRR